MKGYSKPVKITVKGTTYWQVKYPNLEGGTRHRKFFQTRAEAELFAERGNLHMESAGLAVAGLPEKDRSDYIEAAKLLKPYNISVLEAVKEYAVAVAELAPYKKGLPDCIKFFKKQNEIAKDSIPLFDAYGEYLDAMKAQGLSVRHIDSQEHRLKRFIDDMGADTITATIEAPKIEKWIHSLRACEFVEDKTANARADGTRPKVMKEGKCALSVKTKNNYRTALLAFFNYCIRKEYIDRNPIERVALIKEQPKEPEIYTVAEIIDLLNISPKGSDIRAYIAIAAFAGLRHAELDRLTWNKVDLIDKTITLDGAIVKTARRRIVPISDNLAVWLAPYALKTNTSELVLKSNFQNRLDAWKKKNGIKWKANALRHSAASYYLALYNDEYKTAAQMGHSVQILKTNYKGLVKHKDALKYFDIIPTEEKPPLCVDLKAVK